MKWKMSSFTLWMRCAMSAAYRFVLPAATVARGILLRLRNLADQDSTREALLLILLLAMGLSVSLLLVTLLSSDSAGLVLRQDLSM